MASLADGAVMIGPKPQQKSMKRSWNIWLGLLASLASMMVAPASAQQPKPKHPRHYG
jgi:hypothetical protein